MLAIADLEDSMVVSARVFGPKMGLVPYVMPGFDLAKLAAEVFDRDPTVDGLILDKHGIFTFGATAKEAYDRMIHYVTLAEDYVARNGKNPFTPAPLPANLAKPNDVATMLRGAVAVSRGEGRYDRMISEFRSSPDILDFVNAVEVEDMASGARRLDP
jgi:rhamnose utilization protein RhaD (predicted bifunctional aldolase and dehydrogenase)